MNKFKERAKDSFFKREYKNALFNYALSLKEYPDDEESKLGALLCDLALEHEEEAMALFEYYEISKSQDNIDTQKIVKEIIESVDSSMDAISSIFKNYMNEKILFEDGIEYEDFKHIVKERGNFKAVFEDIMFSTRVIISKKEDFLDFLSNLLENGFEEMALNYIEDALKIFPNDKKLQALLEKMGDKK